MLGFPGLIQEIKVLHFYIQALRERKRTDALWLLRSCVLCSHWLLDFPRGKKMVLHIKNTHFVRSVTYVVDAWENCWKRVSGANKPAVDAVFLFIFRNLWIIATYTFTKVFKESEAGWWVMMESRPRRNIEYFWSPHNLRTSDIEHFHTKWWLLFRHADSIHTK